MIYANQLQHAVLIQVGRPPVRVEGSPCIAEIAWTRPGADFDSVDVEIDVGRIIIIEARRLRTELH
ncbi:hypothetical protein D3C77_715850 [compost metagenome]